MRDWIDIGPVPYDEECAQIGVDPDAERKNKAECRRFVAGLRQFFGDPPGTAQFKIQGNNHDFGRYYEVVVTFDDNDPEE